ncbi:uroporphyrinogen-III C-methyltransferase [Paenibacillus sp. UMB4589-SE434]|uniref:uroporphyrinogen-III C-methyltransferase n=1 Tax=Paenibacillus sp. UMB4589-SE434 TaxID=3046314 RepID=UPI00254E8708|nr:uroporphyrinogen-III C-methyltransferase [Paenibacillus sp. UMB4589-SE434]MDK8183773.1 uroporphyrinogen-III C-methyltransferase [Paenibacillus sp. UMB4589-SE434]
MGGSDRGVMQGSLEVSTVGVVYLVGAGPGDAGLITVKGMRYLQEADVVVYDRLAGPRLIQMAKPGAVKIYVGKLPDRHAMKQEQINQLLVELALEGKRVIRLKGGDPCVFGRVGEEAALLKQHGVPFEIVPGVTSAVAVPAYAGIPVTHRERASSFSVITGHEMPERLDERVDWEKLAQATGTLLFLMGVGRIRVIAEQLVRHGRSPETPVAIVRWGTRAEQQTLVGTLSTIADEVARTGFSSPAVIVVGDVVLERELLQWAEMRPLFGQRVLITRARTQSETFVRAIEDLGGEPYEYPVIEVRMPRDEQQLEQIDRVMARLHSYDWIVLTSANGVQYWMEHMKRTKTDIRRIAGARMVAVGPKTAQAMQEYGIIPDRVAEQFSQEGVWSILEQEAQPGQQVLLARGDLARPWLGEMLRGAQIQVDELDIYETILPDNNDPHMVELLQEGAIQIVPLTSSSTVHNLLELLHQSGVENAVELLNQTIIICIGEITANTARNAGLKVAAVAKEATMDGVMESILHVVELQRREMREYC